MAKAVEEFVTRLKDPDRDVRFEAAWALGKIGPAAVPALTEALKDPQARVRSEAAWALGIMGPTAAAAVLERQQSRKAGTWTLPR